MRDCDLIDLRDRLPELLHERLPVAERDEMLAHVDVCADCAEELTLLRAARRVVTTSAPSVDTAAIARAVSTQLQVPSRPPLAVVRGDARTTRDVLRPRRGWTSAPLRAAAAVTIAALGAGAVLRTRTAPMVAHVDTVAIAVPAPSSPNVVPAIATPVVEPHARVTPHAVAVRPATSALGTTFADLSDAELAAIVHAIAADDGSLPPEPEPTRAIVTSVGDP